MIFRRILALLLGILMCAAAATVVVSGGPIRDSKGGGHEKPVTTSAPEIHPGGLASIAALLLGGVALITARAPDARKQSGAPAAHA